MGWSEALPPPLIAETGAGERPTTVREIDDDEGRRLVRIVRRGTGSGWPGGRRRWCRCRPRAMASYEEDRKEQQ